MTKQLSREYIKRLSKSAVTSSSHGGGDGAGGGGVSRSEMMTELTKKVDVEWFDKLFQAFNGDTKVEPNDVETSVTNIKAMFGLWTEQYLSALGNSGNSPVSALLQRITDLEARISALESQT